MRRRRPACRAKGFTLVEALLVVMLAGLLAGIALPGLRQVVLGARRVDALAALLQLQLAQERHHALHRQYGSLGDLRQPERSPAGHYRLALASAAADTFEAHAVATGLQALDAPCDRLTLRVAFGHAVRASGRDGGADNDDAANRRCWRQ